VVEHLLTYKMFCFICCHGGRFWSFLAPAAGIAPASLVANGKNRFILKLVKG
jgi:hypothetical protein